MSFIKNCCCYFTQFINTPIPTGAYLPKEQEIDATLVALDTLVASAPNSDPFSYTVGLKLAIAEVERKENEPEYEISELLLDPGAVAENEL